MRPMLTTYAPGPPYCTYGLRVPASCVLHVPKAQGSVSQCSTYCAYRRTRTSLGRAVRTRTAAPQVLPTMRRTRPLGRHWLLLPAAWDSCPPRLDIPPCLARQATWQTFRTIFEATGVAEAVTPLVSPLHRRVQLSTRTYSNLNYLWLQPLLHTVAASIACGYSLHYIRLQPRLHTVTASMTCGYSLYYVRLQTLLQKVAASITYGYSLDCMRLQPRFHTVTASMTYGYGYSLNDMRLQPL